MERLLNLVNVWWNVKRERCCLHLNATSLLMIWSDVVFGQLCNWLVLATKIWGLKLRNLAEEKRCTALSFSYMDAVICVDRIVNGCAVFDFLLCIFSPNSLHSQSLHYSFSNTNRYTLSTINLYVCENIYTNLLVFLDLYRILWICNPTPHLRCLDFSLS